MKSLNVLYFLLVEVTVILIFLLWWKNQSLTPSKFKDVMENNDLWLFQNHTHQELALTHLPKLINSSNEQNGKHKQPEYIPGISKEGQTLKDIAATLRIPWKLNTSNVYKLRNEIAMSAHNEMILSQNDVRLSENIGYINQTKIVRINEKFYNMLPKVSPIKRNYNRCSIVGNSGILIGRKCGNEIDRADFVIRCNAPPITQFSEDVGHKSDIATVNPRVLTSR
ncbi:CMP-N-acetylneuraminate-poly-alpha-2,8-sialyltransferase-like [Anneissia japonica]|uniref:CMP-N-acetylneuraminate-poly-alpha-2, 8-sialyltransferase-like n=1 Tax=Anneissia japonica TaxID=1529436 RepID=UPI0014256A6E|nr:CMP-N-acetylneuraminate-poly-alpha-2,8-sialyltransferase-like [Anneissia japonica]